MTNQLESRAGKPHPMATCYGTGTRHVYGWIPNLNDQMYFCHVLQLCRL